MAERERDKSTFNREQTLARGKGCKGSTWSVEIGIRELETLIKHQRSPGPHISHPKLLPIQPAAPSLLQRWVIHSLSHQQSLRT